MKDRQIVALSGALTNDQNSALSGIQQRLNRLHELRDSLPSSYDDEVLQAEKWLHDQFQPGNLCDGLQTVSPDLYSRLSQHFEKRRTKLANKSERSLDNVFLQYLLRTCLKTSPLSTFTVIYHGSWQVIVRRPDWHFEGDKQGPLKSLCPARFLIRWNGNPILAASCAKICWQNGCVTGISVKTCDRARYVADRFRRAQHTHHVYRQAHARPRSDAGHRPSESHV